MNQTPFQSPMLPIRLNTLKLSARHMRPLSSTSQTYRLFNQVPSKVSTSAGTTMENADMAFVDSSHHHTFEHEDSAAFVPSVATDSDVSVRGHSNHD